MLDGHHQGDHAPLRGAEEADLLQSKGLKSRRRVTGHVPDGVDRRKLRAPVKDVNGKLFLQRLIRGGYGVRGAHDALDAQAGEDHKRFLSPAKAEIFHRKAVGLNGFDPDTHGRFPSSFMTP